MLAPPANSIAHVASALQWLRQASTLADRILLLIVALLLGLLFWQHDSRAAAQSVQIFQGKHLLRELALDHDQQIAVPGPLGNTLVEIHAGQARVRSSPCNGKQCVHVGWLRHAQDSAACIPNQVLLTIKGAAKGSRFDAIAE